MVLLFVPGTCRRSISAPNASLGLWTLRNALRSTISMACSRAGGAGQGRGTSGDYTRLPNPISKYPGHSRPPAPLDVRHDSPLHARQGIGAGGGMKR